jgi:hypothetical protein
LPLLCSMTVWAVSQALLGNTEASINELQKGIAAATPQQLADVKKVEADFKVQMKALDVDLAKVNAGDRIDPRSSNIKTGSNVPAVLAITTVGAFFGYIGFLVAFHPHSADVGLINVAIGWLGGSASAVISYYFGASAKSDDKGTST